LASASQFLTIDSFDDIARLIGDGIEENLNLDYKASPALSRDSKPVDEMCKDVSAFANSAGGQLVYGVEEDRATRKPTGNDPGVTDAKISREWIEQIINSKIQPRISGIRTVQIDNRKGGSIFVITVPASQTGPHQAPDKKYYKRFDLSSVPMEDYEIRDVMRRATTPDLFVELAFGSGNRQRIDYASNQEMSKPFPLVARIGNRSPQPADYAVVEIGVAPELTTILPGDYTQLGNRPDPRGIPLNWFQIIIRPPRVPIFREYGQKLTPQDFHFGFHSDLLGGDRLFDFAITIAAPGFTDTQYWTARSRAGVLQLFPPDHPFTKTR
jgi:Schlafen, AlbA_2